MKIKSLPKNGIRTKSYFSFGEWLNNQNTVLLLTTQVSVYRISGPLVYDRTGLRDTGETMVHLKTNSSLVWQPMGAPSHWPTPAITALEPQPEGRAQQGRRQGRQGLWRIMRYVNCFAFLLHG